MNFPSALEDFPEGFPDNLDLGDDSEFQFQNNSELIDGLINGTIPFPPNSVNIYVTISIYFLSI